MAVFNSNKDLDSTIVVIGIHSFNGRSNVISILQVPAVKVSIQVQS